MAMSDNELRRKALVDQLNGTSDPINGTEPVGTPQKAASDPASGGDVIPAMPAAAPTDPTTPPLADAPAAAPSGLKGGPLGQYGNALEGFDSGKLANKEDPKYDIGRVLSNFDPRQGVTGDVLKALNGLGIGQFSGSGDKLHIANGDPRFDGVSDLDVVRGFHDPTGGGGWQYGVEGGPSGPAPQGGAQPKLTSSLLAPSSLSSLLQGNPQANIQQALGALQQQSPTIQTLLAQLMQGAQ
jgi:hypothetical protein